MAHTSSLAIAVSYALVAILFPPDADAYLDPGTGSLLLQAVAAAFVTVLAFWRRLRFGIRDFLMKGDGGSAKADGEPTEKQ